MNDLRNRLENQIGIYEMAIVADRNPPAFMGKRYYQRAENRATVLEDVVADLKDILHQDDLS